MANSHLTTAHQWGVQQALKQAGYESIDQVQKEAEELGLFEQPQQAEPTKTASPVDAVMASIAQNLKK